MLLIPAIVLIAALVVLILLGWPWSPSERPSTLIDESRAAAHSRPRDHGVNSVEPVDPATKPAP